MKKILPILLLLLIFQAAHGQNVPRFAKYSIGTTGCQVYLPADPGDFDLTWSEDSSKVYTAEVEFNEYGFGVICIEFRENLADESVEDRVDLLTGYLDFLQEQFGITGSAGYGKGHTLDDFPDANGVIDYWEDEEGLQFAVKGWVDAYHMAVLYIVGEEEYPIYNVQDMFLNGFRFPEE